MAESDHKKVFVKDFSNVQIVGEGHLSGYKGLMQQLKLSFLAGSIVEWYLFILFIFICIVLALMEQFCNVTFSKPGNKIP